MAGCAPLPALTFVSGGDDGGAHPSYDATIPGADAGGPGEDADAEDDASLPGDLNPSDDAGPDAPPTIACGSTFVTTCALCPGAPLRCKKGTRDQCIDDCASCAASSYPCIHCSPPDAAPHGNCVAVGANGQVACTTTSLCACNSASDCPQLGGASETCDLVGGHLRCLTCGSPATDDAGCVSAGGSAGVCQIGDGSAPKCE
jgi:hypothetical protein